ncbi:hypothetical protein K474DRAFT_1703165 [Panus rudis PR-1116 ss-1]|nr:hypothetical protein K474DRAFT_1703165 [Panus rudis PR-1116 ss-1]
MAATLHRVRMHFRAEDRLTSGGPLVIHLPSMESPTSPDFGRTVHWDNDEPQLRRNDDDSGSTGAVAPPTVEIQSGETSVHDRVVSDGEEASMQAVPKANIVTDANEEPRIMVSPRQSHAMRASGCVVYWFESTGVMEIPAPPPIQGKTRPQKYDLYLHRVPGRDVQAWIYNSPDGKSACQWVLIQQGASVKLPSSERPRYFVVTKAGKPSFVSTGTLAKNYASLQGANEAKGTGGDGIDVLKGTKKVGKRQAGRKRDI